MTRHCLRLIAASAAMAGALVARPASAAQVTAVTSVKVVKPVSLTKLQDLDFGTLTYSSFTGSRTVTISPAGVLGCAADIVCSGATTAAGFNVRGTNRMTVLITVSGGSLSNGIDSIPFTPNAPPSITLTSSGMPGTDLYIGGSIDVNPDLAGGVYSGTMTVTADYQ